MHRVHAGRLASQAELSRWKDRLQTAPVCFVLSSLMWRARRSANKRAPGWRLTLAPTGPVFTGAGKHRRLNGEFLDGARSRPRMRGICGRMSCGGTVKEVGTAVSRKIIYARKYVISNGKDLTVCVQDGGWRVSRNARHRDIREKRAVENSLEKPK